jgi:hypothetical protein
LTKQHNEGPFPNNNPILLRNRKVSSIVTRQQQQHKQVSARVRLVVGITLIFLLVLVLALEWKIVMQHQTQQQQQQRPPPKDGVSLSSSSSSSEVQRPSSPLPQHVTVKNPSSGRERSKGSNAVAATSAGPFLYNTVPPDLTTIVSSSSSYPDWIIQYLKWHQRIRHQFPDMQLFTHPDAPPLLIRVCLGLCGGLHDRIGQLPWDLYLANQTNRILLLAWQRPKPMEEFLLPAHPTIFNWTVPLEAQFGFQDMAAVRNHKALFDGYPEDHPTDTFWSHDVDAALERATTGSYRTIKILRHRLLGHLGQDALEQRLVKHYQDEQHDGQRPSSTTLYEEEQKLRHVKLFDPPLFGQIFWQLFFRPHPLIETQFESVMRELELIPQQFTAVHCRVRHPKAVSYGIQVLGKNPVYPADKTGLPWQGNTKQWAMSVATRAFQCATTVQERMGIIQNNKNQEDGTTVSHHPIYFMSDSNDLVRHVAHELSDPDFVAHANASQGEIDFQLYHQVLGGSGSSKHNDYYKNSNQRVVVVARNVTLENAHIDRQKGREASAYYATFIDLLVAMHAKCVIYGIGYYAAFAAHVSGTPCQGVYQKEAWGDDGGTPKLAHSCTEEELQQHEYNKVV